MTLITYKQNADIFNDIDRWMDGFWDFNYINDNQKINPDYNIIENKSSYTITADLPGVEKKDIDISMSDGMFTISGERKTSEDNKNKLPSSSLVRYGKFEKSFYLPEDVNINNIKAKMNNGVLSLELGKSKKISSDIKKIAVK